MPDRVPDLRYGDKLPPLPTLDPERGFVSVRQTVNYGTAEIVEAPLPRRTRELQALNRVLTDAEADPDGTVDVAELVRILKILVDRVL